MARSGLSPTPIALVGMLLSGAFIAGGVLFSYRSVEYERPDSLTKPLKSELNTATTSGVSVNEPSSRNDRAAFAEVYIPTPVPLKAIYMSQCVVGTPSFREELVRLIEETELNAVIIDVKDYTGGIAFPVGHIPLLAPFRATHCGAQDMRAFVASLKARGIYTIARITVFQDPLYAKAHPDAAVKKASEPSVVWSDHKGLHFIDVSAPMFWEYIVTLARETHKVGFDELNFDYIRFPSDGPMHDISFPHTGNKTKAEALELFFRHLHRELSEPSQYPQGVQRPVLSADLFGFTTSNTDDLNIGQVLERALPYFDYIAPMVYPSHYPKGSFGYGNPNHHPYEIIHRAMSDGVRRTVAPTSPVPTLDGERIYEERIVFVGTSTATKTEHVFTGRYTKPVYDKNKLRPWLQDFDYGGTYDVAEVRAQIQATYDAGLHSWMLWSPSNRYTRSALLDAATSGETLRSGE